MDSRSALMAASVRNNVWAAPGQDAQFLCKTTAPLTGEDHGRALCHTGDAIPGTSSLHDCDLVRECFLLLLLLLLCMCLGASQRLPTPSVLAYVDFMCASEHFYLKIDALYTGSRPTCLAATIFTVPARDCTLSVLMLPTRGAWLGCETLHPLQKLARKRCVAHPEQLDVLISATHLQTAQTGASLNGCRQHSRPLMHTQICIYIYSLFVICGSVLGFGLLIFIQKS